MSSTLSSGLCIEASGIPPINMENNLFDKNRSTTLEVSFALAVLMQVKLKIDPFTANLSNKQNCA